MDSRRRSSGRSKILENSIRTITEISQNKSLEELFTYAINNNLPNEIRSISWRIALGIFNLNDLKNWSKLAKESRENYSKLILLHYNENISSFFKNENDSKLDEKTVQILKNIKNEISKISQQFDFFKSEIISELVYKISFLWVVLNPDPINVAHSVTISSSVIYSLYPSIIHIDLSSITNFDNLEAMDIQNLYYYLNIEEEFDADVYAVFEGIMKQGIIQSQNYSKFEITQENFKVIDSASLELESKKLNKIDRIINVYLKIVNPNLYGKIYEKKIDLYGLVGELANDLLSNYLTLENTVYFWDCIFFHDTIYKFDKFELLNDNRFTLLDFVILSIISVNEKAFDTQEWENQIKLSIQNLDNKEIIKKSFKFREKINAFFS